MNDVLLSKILDKTGSGQGNKGFILYYVDETGAANKVTLCSSTIVESGLKLHIQADNAFELPDND